MSYENVKQYFENAGLGERFKELEQSSATVELAAKALGCEPERIAKTMSFLLGDEAILIVTAGDAKVDNKKFKEHFHQKAKMIPGELVEDYIGHAPGGVCPFVLKQNIRVFLDVSLKRFEIVYPAGGSGNSAVELTLPELEKYSQSEAWVDVCKGWSEE
ncbi:MAG: YbaK/EbsC family protein [Muricomes sp.]